MLVGRDLCARRSELVALLVEDLAEATGGAATVVIRRSKTDQGGAGVTAWLSPRSNKALRRYLDAAGISSGPIFRGVLKGGGRVRDAALTDNEVATVLRVAKRARIDTSSVSGHSLRVGMAQDLIGAGAELPAVMVAGRWRSPVMVARYGEHQLAGRGAVAAYYRRRSG